MYDSISVQPPPVVGRLAESIMMQDVQGLPPMESMGEIRVQRDPDDSQGEEPSSSPTEPDDDDLDNDEVEGDSLDEDADMIVVEDSE
jgi:hypothetical protein